MGNQIPGILQSRGDEPAYVPKAWQLGPGLSKIHAEIHFSKQGSLTGLLIGWRLCSQPIKCQVWKSLLINMDLLTNMDISY